MPIFGTRAAERDIVRYWNGPPIPARIELQTLLKGCRAAGRVDESCITDCMRLDKYLRKRVAAAPEDFVREKQVWRRTAPPIAMPVYRTTGDPFVVFTICDDANDEKIVVAVHFGRRDLSASPDDADRRLWSRIVEPRLRMIALGGPWVERGRPA